MAANKRSIGLPVIGCYQIVCSKLAIGYPLLVAHPPQDFMEFIFGLVVDAYLVPNARKSLPLVENRIQSVQLAPNVYELRERGGVRVVGTATQLQQVPVQDKKRNVVAAQVTQKSLLPVVGNDFQAAQPESRVAERRVAAPVTKPYGIEISNGNGVTGMARKVAGSIGNEGFLKVRLTNQQSFQVALSQVNYRSGYREQAQSLASMLPGYPRIAQTNSLRGDTDIKVVLGKDMANKLAHFERNQISQRKIRLALNEPTKYSR